MSFSESLRECGDGPIEVGALVITPQWSSLPLLPAIVFSNEILETASPDRGYSWFEWYSFVTVSGKMLHFRCRDLIKVSG